jgi:hypothetical protein
MRRRIAARSHFVVTRGEYATALVKHERAHCDVIVGERIIRMMQRLVHGCFIINEWLGELHEPEATGAPLPGPSVFSAAHVN